LDRKSGNLDVPEILRASKVCYRDSHEDTWGSDVTGIAMRIHGERCYRDSHEDTWWSDDTVIAMKIHGGGACYRDSHGDTCGERCYRDSYEVTWGAMIQG
jgi:hypothetical protein